MMPDTRAPLRRRDTQFKLLCRQLNIGRWPLRTYKQVSDKARACAITYTINGKFAHVKDELLVWEREFKAVLVRQRGPEATGM
jgi:hypothetical protein